MTINIVSYCAIQLGVSSQVVRRIGLQAPFKYKRFRIKKRAAGEFRDVAQPAREVKALQRAILNFFLNACPIHPAATAYVVGGSIVKNASMHKGAKYILKLDFSNFFGSINVEDLKSYLKESACKTASEVEINFIARALCWQRARNEALSLCIGAPSSPFFSNAIMFRFDDAVATICSKHGAVYSRYSDDITISAPERSLLLEVESLLANVCSEMPYPKLRLNAEKRVLVGRASKLWVTGVCLSTQGNLTIGRLRKRGIRAGVSRFLCGELNEAEILRLRGEIAFASSIEKDFLEKLYAWYGARVGLLLTPRISNQ
jgi:RNA-directed DNA polymerase